MPVKDKIKKVGRSHTPANAHTAAHREPNQDRGHREMRPRHDDEEEAPHNRIDTKDEDDREAREIHPRSKRHHAGIELNGSVEKELKELDADVPAEPPAEKNETADEGEENEEMEPSPEELQAEEATVQAAVGMVPRDEDAGVPGKDRTSYDADTAIKLYLREIGQVKLLTPQEEIELAARIKKGDKKAREDVTIAAT